MILVKKDDDDAVWRRERKHKVCGDHASTLYIWIYSGAGFYGMLVMCMASRTVSWNPLSVGDEAMR